MNSRRVYYGLLGLVGILLVGLLAGTYGVNVLLQSRAQKLVDLKTQSQVITSQQIGLAKAKKEVTTYSELNTIARTIVPQDKDQAKAVLEITNLAAESGIPQLSSITFPQSTLGGSAAASTSTSTTTTPTPTAAPTASKGNLTQLTQVKGLNGVYQLQITIQQSPDNSVSYDNFLTFLSKLEQNRRTAQVSSISLKPDAKDNAKVGFTLVVNEFIKP